MELLELFIYLWMTATVTLFLSVSVLKLLYLWFGSEMGVGGWGKVVREAVFFGLVETIPVMAILLLGAAVNIGFIVIFVFFSCLVSGFVVSRCYHFAHYYEMNRSTTLLIPLVQFVILFFGLILYGLSVL